MNSENIAKQKQNLLSAIRVVKAAMGCVNSKAKLLIRRPRRGRAAQRKREGYHHAIASNSSNQNPNPNRAPNIAIVEAAEAAPAQDNETLDFSKELLQASDWSTSTAGRKTPKTPIETPQGEPETINTWELMVGLEDDKDDVSHLQLKREPESESDSAAFSKPIWLQLTESESILADLDPEIASTFRRALQQLGPPDISRLRSAEADRAGPTRTTVQERVRAFQQKIDRGSKKRLLNRSNMPRGLHEKVDIVIYFTSLRGVRKTYEDCCHVRVIFRGYGVRVDEKDVSMDTGFRDELSELLGGGPQSVGGLPRVFVKERYVGGVGEVKHLHESGELEQVLEGCARLEEGGGVACGGCGDVKFVVCSICNGSSKLFEEDGDGFVNCPDCNENGLVRCPICCF